MKKYIEIKYHYYSSFGRDETDYFEAIDDEDAINQLKKKVKVDIIHDLKVITKEQYDSILKQRENYKRWNSFLK
jgi:hypothetical protein